MPLAIHIEKANVNDSKLIEPTIKKLPKEIIKQRKFIKNIIADKGYIIDKKRRDSIKKQFRIKVITPVRKNSKIKLHSRESALLKRRIRVERNRTPQKTLASPASNMVVLHGGLGRKKRL